MKWQFVGHTPFPNYFFSLLNQQVGWYTRHVWSNRHICWWKSQCFAGWAAMSVAQIPMVGWILLVGLINFGCNPIPLGIWGVHPNHRGNPKGDVTPIIWVSFNHVILCDCPIVSIPLILFPPFYLKNRARNSPCGLKLHGASQGVI